MSQDGECARLIAAVDWGTTSLGPSALWPVALRVTVANLLGARQPMLLFWGPDLVQFYNDAFVPSFGAGKHPAAMGQPARVCWDDAWPVIGAQIEAVTRRGEPAWFEDALVPIHRNGRMEEVFWTYSYSPAFDDDQQIAGVLVIVTETTAKVVGARRLAALSTLGAALARATEPEAVFEALRAVAADHAADLPLVRVEGGDRASYVPFDEGYANFLQQVDDQVTAALVRIDAAAASRATEQQRDNLLFQAPVPTALLVGPELVFQLANPAYHKLVGRDPTGRPFSEAFPEMADDPFHRDLLEVYVTGTGHTARERRVPLDPGTGVEDRWFDFHVEPLRRPSGAVYGMMILAVDVTEHVRALAAKDQFMAMLGHELRNPLAPIATAVELMKRRVDPPPELGTIQRQLRHVTRLVDDLLDVSRITRGAIELRRRPVALVNVVDAAVEAAETLLALREHQLQVEVGPDLQVDGDEARLTQVFTNLLTNAARYTPPQGTIRIVGEAHDDQIRIRVIDNGVGMSPALLARVFDLFVQGARGADRIDGGLGIGLAVVKNLVSLHGGTVTAHSDGPGAGSTITVCLPRREPAREAPPASEVTPRDGLRAAANGRRVLVVDDNEDAAMLLGELLRNHGHDTVIAHDPATALVLVPTFRPEVAVLDIGLPGMDGYDLATRIRQLPWDCRFIALTGYGQETDRERAVQAGFEAHFVKPVPLKALLAALE